MLSHGVLRKHKQSLHSKDDSIIIIISQLSFYLRCQVVSTSVQKKIYNTYFNRTDHLSAQLPLDNKN